jgi:hypothetical protein
MPKNSICDYCIEGGFCGKKPSLRCFEGIKINTDSILDESKNKAISMLRTAQRLCREGLPSFANVKIEEALKLL